jgi:hypothetical protein
MIWRLVDPPPEDALPPSAVDDYEITVLVQLR